MYDLLPHTAVTAVRDFAAKNCCPYLFELSISVLLFVGWFCTPANCTSCCKSTRTSRGYLGGIIEIWISCSAFLYISFTTFSYLIYHSTDAPGDPQQYMILHGAWYKNVLLYILHRFCRVSFSTMCDSFSPSIALEALSLLLILLLLVILCVRLAAGT